MTDKVKYVEVAWANRFLDCYTGDNYDTATAYWNLYTDGEKEPSNLYDDDIIISLSNQPRGVRVTISVPVCPMCEEPIECCESNSSCNFDWKKWEEDKFV